MTQKMLVSEGLLSLLSYAHTAGAAIPTVIVSTDTERGIGYQMGELLMDPVDRAFFHAFTLNKAVLVGGRTFDRHATRTPHQRPLVYSRRRATVLDNATTEVKPCYFGTIEQAFEKGRAEVIAGGERTYGDYFDFMLAKRRPTLLLRTVYHDSPCVVPDALFPDVERDFRVSELKTVTHTTTYAGELTFSLSLLTPR